MQSILFIGTNKTGSSRDAIVAARKLGYSTVLFTDRRSFIDNKDQFPEVNKLIYVNLKKMSNIRSEIKSLISKETQIEAIVSFIDPYVYKAAVLSKEFCNTNVSDDAIYKMQNKILTRDSLANNPYNPWYKVYNPRVRMSSLIKKVDNQFPIIVKSPTSTASKDVYLATDQNELTECIKTLKAKYSRSRILLENYCNGPQYLVEALVANK